MSSPCQGPALDYPPGGRTKRLTLSEEEASQVRRRSPATPPPRPSSTPERPPDWTRCWPGWPTAGGGGGHDRTAVGRDGSWCHEQIKPWFHDHVDVDEQLTRRWAGGDIDLTRPIPSDLIVAATEAAPEMMNTVGPYLTMQALPDTLRAAEPRARDIYATGWRPPEPNGPTRDELVDVLTRTR